MSATRHIFVLTLALALLVPAAHGASRRRSVRSGPVASQPSNCHTFGLVRAGLKASYLSVAPGGNVTFTVTYISDTPTQTKTTQHVVAPSGTSDVDTTLDGEIVGTLRALKHIKTVGSTTVPVIGKVTTEVNIDFVPSLAAGPAQGWCTGATWTVSPSTETITTSGGSFPLPPVIVTTAGSVGQVLAVGESITVAGGTFNTVKYRGAIVSGQTVQPAITWVSMTENIVVKQDTLDTNGAVTSTTELTAVQ
ncbi:MAG TPA: hypothetical protein VJZ00_13230 [Thermoanaerobaculia bacterium]|nr:hypothetical protein [Thermoanaerobaculia bacterium]